MITGGRHLVAFKLRVVHADVRHVAIVLDILSLLGVMLALIVLIVVPPVVCWLKGKRLWATLGFITGWHWIPVFRLAKPSSWWARKYYTRDKLARSNARFPNDAIPRTP